MAGKQKRFPGQKQNTYDVTPQQVLGRLTNDPTADDKRPFIIRQAFRIPNTPEGRKLIEDMRKHLNTETYWLRVRGRGSRKGKGTQQVVPLEKAEWLGVYFEYTKKAAETLEKMKGVHT